MFKEFFSRRRQKREQEEQINTLYSTIVEQSRQPLFYQDYQIPDTPEGRYELLMLHMWLVLRQLGKQKEPQTREFSQNLFDFMFADVDMNLRELGINDLAVGKRVRRMAEAFYGRIAAYDAGMEQGTDALVAALDRNLYQYVNDVPRQSLDWMVHYIHKQMEQLESLPDTAMMAGQIHFYRAEDL